MQLKLHKIRTCVFVYRVSLSDLQFLAFKYVAFSYKMFLKLSFQDY